MADLAGTLWRAADKLRGSMDAAQYKDFVLGLVFLRYLSGSSEVFSVPPEARWEHLAASAENASIGELLDHAMVLLMKANPSLAGVLPRIFGRDHVDHRRLGELVGLIGDVRLAGHGGQPARDVLGEVYEYFLDKFASAEGRRGGEFYTPGSVVRVLVEVLEPYHGRVYDPCCGSGGMFVQAE